MLYSTFLGLTPSGFIPTRVSQVSAYLCQSGLTMLLVWKWFPPGPSTSVPWKVWRFVAGYRCHGSEGVVWGQEYELPLLRHLPQVKL